MNCPRCKQPMDRTIGPIVGNHETPSDIEEYETYMCACVTPHIIIRRKSDGGPSTDPAYTRIFMQDTDREQLPEVLRG